MRTLTAIRASFVALMLASGACTQGSDIASPGATNPGTPPGGGTPPGEALGLVRRYVDDRPFGECVSFALFILMAAIYGTDQEPAPGKAEPAESLPTTAAA